MAMIGTKALAVMKRQQRMNKRADRRAAWKRARERERVRMREEIAWEMEQAVYADAAYRAHKLAARHG